MFLPPVVCKVYTTMTQTSFQADISDNDDASAQNPGIRVLDTDITQGLANTLGQPVFDEVTVVFARDASKKIADICSCYELNRIQELASNAHSLKSSAAMMGCAGLAITLAAIETAARNTQLEKLDALTGQLTTLLQESLNCLQEFCASGADTSDLDNPGLARQ